MSGKLPTQTYQDIDDTKVPFDYLRNKLKVKHLETKKRFYEKHPHVEKFMAERSLDLGKIREHSAKVLGAGAMTGSLLFSPVQAVKSLPPPHEIIAKLQTQSLSIPPEVPQETLVDTMTKVLPAKTRPLTREEEKYLERLFDSILEVPARATLEGEHLNTTYGLIGAEQHLRRYPGDSVSAHGEGKVLKEGMAPGLGAWGYFAPSRPALSPQLEETERWYAVVQTLYLPDWNTRQPHLKNWYKYRKVLIVNTKNGQAVVGAISDSGPAAWTGKHFGGSPEVMMHLGGERYKKGPVVIFFVDDPENKVPLGPVEYNKVGLPESFLFQV